MDSHAKLAHVQLQRPDEVTWAFGVTPNEQRLSGAATMLVAGTARHGV